MQENNISDIIAYSKVQKLGGGKRQETEYVPVEYLPTSEIMANIRRLKHR